MRIAVYLPLLCAVVFAVVAPRMAVRRLSPRAGLWTLTLGGSLAAAASTWSLVLLAGTLLDDTLPHRTQHTIQAPVTDPIAIIAAVTLAAGLGRLYRTGHARGRLHRRMRRVCPPGTGTVVVLDDPVPRAFALPGEGGRVVVSHGMLSALTSAERRVLFAHERAHLHERHHWHTAAASAGAALNPLLTPIRNACVHLCERCADEAAAALVGDRALAASSLARAALATAAVDSAAVDSAAVDSAAVDSAAVDSADMAVPLGYQHTGVAARVVALQHRPAPARPGLAVALLALAGIAVAADVDATGDFLTLVLHATLHFGG